QAVEYARHERHVRAGQDRDADGVRVLLDRSLDDLLRRLVEACVDHLHARVAKRARDDLRTAVVPVETRLGDDDSDLARHGAESRARAQASVSAGTAARRGTARATYRAARRRRRRMPARTRAPQ